MSIKMRLQLMPEKTLSWQGEWHLKKEPVMQHDLEQGVSVMSSPSLCKIEDKVSLTVDERRLVALQVAEGMDEGYHHCYKRRQGRRLAQPRWYLYLVVGDGVLLVGLLLLMFLLAPFFHLESPIFHHEIVWNTTIPYITLGIILWSMSTRITQAYDLSSASNRFIGAFKTLLALILTFLLWILLATPLLKVGVGSSFKYALLFFTIAVPIMSMWRVVFAEIKNLPRFRQQAVIVGVNAAGETVAKELQSLKRSDISILGYIDESTEEKSYKNGLPVLGGRSILRYLVYNGMIDLIIITLKYGTNQDLLREATDAAQHGISVLPMAVVFENSTGKIPVEHVGDQWYVALQSERVLSPFYLCGKKALDLVCGIFGLLVLCLMLPIIALCIYLDSPGPVFYSQERVGFQGKPFRIYKFRTMRMDAEAGGHAVWAAASDKRITRVGRFLRSTHLDEVPQVFNILRGDMSLIGPRPERAKFIKELEKTLPFYGYRLAVKPGLTGWAQVKYRYGRTDNDALIKLQYDLYYIKRQSFMLDLFIILKTVDEVLSLRGA
jgi:exopolysaccharide biosynthesis polyprenyl glycosylphosphotransferase